MLFQKAAVTALFFLPALALAEDPDAMPDAMPMGDSMAAVETVVDLAVATPELSTLTEAVTALGIAAFLANMTGVTVFAPTDEAFDAVPEKYTEIEWGYHLGDILLYHITNGTITSGDLEQDLSITMWNGEIANITSLDPPMINNSTIITADVLADNGAVHVIDQVMLPPSAIYNIVDAAVMEPDFSTLVSLLDAADLVTTLAGDGPFTVFAPINMAFEALDEATVKFLTSPEGKQNLTDILTYHAASGIYHSNDAPPGTSTIDMLSGDQLFVTTPSLSDYLGNFSFPNVTSFIGDMLGDMGGEDMEEPAMTETMKRRAAMDAAKDKNMTTDESDMGMGMSDDIWSITLNGGAATVIYSDILLSNGILHIIDGVLLPSQTEGLEEDTVLDQLGEVFGDLGSAILDAVTSKSNPDNMGGL